MRVILKGAALAVCLACSSWAYADTIVIDFEGLADGDAVGAQYQASDAVFSGATALVSGALGGSLNELDFPPLSGDAVAFAASAPMEISFLRPVIRVVGYFTYAGGPLTLTGLRAGTAVAWAASAGAENYLTLPGPGHERIELGDAAGLKGLVISGGPNFQVALDDLELTFAAPVPVPEPSIALLAGVTLVTVARRRRRS